MRPLIFKPPRNACMHIFERGEQPDATKSTALHPLCEVQSEHLDTGGILIDFENLVVVVYEDRTQLALRCINHCGELSNSYLLVEEIGEEAKQLARGWSIQCREAVSTSIPSFKEQAEQNMQEAWTMVQEEVRKCLVFPRLALVAAN